MKKHLFFKLSYYKAKAFTMLELILVVVIIGLLAVAAPRYFKIEEYNLLVFTRASLGALRHAQKVAIGMGCHVQVSATADTISLKLRESCTTGDFNKDIANPDTKVLDYSIKAPSGIVMVATNFPIYFDRAGRVHNNTGDIGEAQLLVNTNIINIVGETGYSYEP